jgi:beta-N-acetylhexosaminidase
MCNRSFHRGNRYILFLAILILLTAPSFGLRAASAAIPSDKNINRKISKLLNSLTLEEKVGQLFVIGGNWQEQRSFNLIAADHFGNACLGSLDVNKLNPDQVKNLTKQLQSEALKYNHQIPMFIFTDQEGGLVNRLENGFLTFPSQGAVAMIAPEMIGQVAQTTARQLHEVGINVNLAPVVDVVYNRAGHIARARRAFGNDPQKVIQCAQIYIERFQEEQIIACVKHFPNDGDLDRDPHYFFPVNQKSKEELLATSLVPYLQMLKSGLIKIMLISHVAVPALEPDPSVPASLSKNVIKGFIRGELGYRGLVVIDEMNMRALGKDGKRPTEEQVCNATVKAVDAGADLLIFSGYEQNQVAAYHALLKAYQVKKLSLRQLNQTIKRILDLKMKLSY